MGIGTLWLLLFGLLVTGGQPAPGVLASTAPLLSTLFKNCTTRPMGLQGGGAVGGLKVGPGVSKNYVKHSIRIFFDMGWPAEEPFL